MQYGLSSQNFGLFLSPILMPFSRAFGTAFDESGWSHMDGDSDFTLSLLLSQSLLARSGTVFQQLNLIEFVSYRMRILLALNAVWLENTVVLYWSETFVFLWFSKLFYTSLILFCKFFEVNQRCALKCIGCFDSDVRDVLSELFYPITNIETLLHV
jgi:hypothetical protein